MSKFVLSGNFRMDHFGNIIADQCVSDNDHLCNSKTDDIAGKPICRYPLNRLFDNLVGKKGSLLISIEFLEETKA